MSAIVHDKAKSIVVLKAKMQTPAMTLKPAVLREQIRTDTCNFLDVLESSVPLTRCLSRPTSLSLTGGLNWIPWGRYALKCASPSQGTCHLHSSQSLPAAQSPSPSRMPMDIFLKNKCFCSEQFTSLCSFQVCFDISLGDFYIKHSFSPEK
jgi:hypothetical protein